MSDVEEIKAKIRKDIQGILEKLETDHPGIVKNGLAAVLGSDEAANIAAFSGCVTMVRGTSEAVSVNTNPPGAKIDFSNGQSCKSPCTIKTKRNKSLQITITKSGCGTQTATMVPSLAGGGVILGGLIDYGTGAVYDLQPNPMIVTLSCVRGV